MSWQDEIHSAAGRAGVHWRDPPPDENGKPHRWSGDRAAAQLAEEASVSISVSQVTPGCALLDDQRFRTDRTAAAIVKQSLPELNTGPTFSDPLSRVPRIGHPAVGGHAWGLLVVP